MTAACRRPRGTRTDHVLRPDPSRVVSLIFLPGQEPTASGESRSTAVLDRVLALSDEEVHDALVATTATFADRHRDLEGDVGQRTSRSWRTGSSDPDSVSAGRRRLIGAYFTQEYAVEGAALFNPSMVEHPDQSGLEDGSTRFLMSLRAVGEGHLSSIEWRTGTIDAADEVVLDRRDPRWRSCRRRGRRHTRGPRSSSSSASSTATGRTPRSCSTPCRRRSLARSWTVALESLHDQRLTRGAAVQHHRAARAGRRLQLRHRVRRRLGLQERVIMPRGPSESRGMEDVRLVRFPQADGRADYFGTYTATTGMP